MMSAREIANRLDLKQYSRSWRGRCPVCDYDGNTFSLRAGRDGKPLPYCASCQDREGLREALARVTGQPKSEKNEAAPADDAARREKNRERAMSLWRGSEPAAGTLVERYLATRGLPDLAQSEALRYRGDCRHPEGGSTPGMVALVQDVDGKPIAVHRTYLRRDGTGKAPAVPDKASLGPVWGGAIRLAAATPEIVVGEGIETAAAAGLLLNLPAWAAISAGNLATGLVLPVGICAVVIAVDRDPAGEKAARRAASRWQAEGRRVRLMIPELAGTDAADVLKAQCVSNG